MPGDTAVQCFYAVSGFYMALVLNEKYAPGSYWLFLSNRFMRLFPAYAAVLLLTVVFVIGTGGGDLLKAWQNIWPPSFGQAISLFGSQLFIFGQDLYVFLALHDGVITFTPDFSKVAQPLFTLSPIPQAWTLGVELCFYLVAPAIVRRGSFTIASILLGSLMLRLGLQFVLGYSGDPWSYRFFPSELALFLSGALGYRLYAENPENRRSLLPAFVMLILAVAICLAINRWHGVSRIASLCFLATAISAIPFLFGATKRLRVDRYLGEMSYPIYICHILIIQVVDAVAAPAAWRGPVIIAVTIMFSAALYQLVESPVDAWRQRRFLRRSQPAPSAMAQPFGLATPRRAPP